MEEDGRRWKKMDEKKRVEKSRKKGQKKFCLESVWDALGSLVGVQIAPKKNNWALGYDFFEKKIWS